MRSAVSRQPDASHPGVGGGKPADLRPRLIRGVVVADSHSHSSASAIITEPASVQALEIRLFVERRGQNESIRNRLVQTDG